MKPRSILGILFLLVQCGFILLALFIPEKFFCWAPYDEHTHLQTEVYINTIKLNNHEVNSRYRYPMNTWEPRAIANVFNIVEQYESTYGKSDSVQVKITYSTNGRPKEQWCYPKREK